MKNWECEFAGQAGNAHEHCPGTLTVGNLATPETVTFPCGCKCHAYRAEFGEQEGLGLMDEWEQLCAAAKRGNVSLEGLVVAMPAPHLPTPGGVRNVSGELARIFTLLRSGEPPLKGKRLLETPEHLALQTVAARLLIARYLTGTRR